jgi:hypothetical protein
VTGASSTSPPPTSTDLIAYLTDVPAAIEVELAARLKPRLRAILQQHREWAMTARTSAVIYICGDEDAYSRVERAAEHVGLTGSGYRIELLDTVIEHTRRAFDARKSRDRRAAA